MKIQDFLPTSRSSPAILSPTSVPVLSKSTSFFNLRPILGTGIHHPIYPTGSGVRHSTHTTQRSGTGTHQSHVSSGTGAPYPIMGNHTIHHSGSRRPYSTGTAIHHTSSKKSTHVTGHTSTHSRGTSGEHTSTRYRTSTVTKTSVVSGITSTIVTVTTVACKPTTVTENTTLSPPVITSVAAVSQSVRGSCSPSSISSSSVFITLKPITSGVVSVSPASQSATGGFGSSIGNYPVISTVTVTSIKISTVTVTMTPSVAAVSATVAPGRCPICVSSQTCHSTKTPTQSHTSKTHQPSGGFWNGTYHSGTSYHASGTGVRGTGSLPRGTGSSKSIPTGVNVSNGIRSLSSTTIFLTSTLSTGEQTGAQPSTATMSVMY